MVVVGGLMAAFSAAPGATADNLHDKKHKVQHKIKNAQGSLDEASSRLRQATTALIQAQADLSSARAYLGKTRAELAAAEALDREMQAKLDNAIARLRQAQSELAAGQAKVAEQSRMLSATVAESFQSGDSALMGLSVVLNSQDPSQLASQLSAVDTVVGKQDVILDQLQASRVLLAVQEAKTQSIKKEVAKRRKAAAENLVRKQALEQQAVAAEQQVSQLVTLRSKARADAIKAKKADLKELKKLQAERDRIQALILAQASHGAGYNGPVTGNGFLSWPVLGPVTSPFGWRINPVWGYRSFHDGIDIGAGCGTPIKATAPGKVISEYYQTAWGNRIIIDHGVHYGVGVATIDNHLSGYAVSVGDHVKRGQVVGYIGTTGWSTGCHLHFTVMENGVAVDPMKWL